MTHSFLRYNIAHWPTSSLSLSLSLFHTPLPHVRLGQQGSCTNTTAAHGTISLNLVVSVYIHIQRVLQSVGHGDSSNICLCSRQYPPPPPYLFHESVWKYPPYQHLSLKNPYQHYNHHYLLICQPHRCSDLYTLLAAQLSPTSELNL